MAVAVLGRVWERVWLRGVSLGSVAWAGAKVGSGEVAQGAKKRPRGES